MKPQRTMAIMTGSSRDVFPLRFKNPQTRAALRHLSEQTGTSMTEIAERAIEHEVALQGADLERRLEDALEVVRAYRPDRDLDAYIEHAAAGESAGLDPLVDVAAAHASVESTRSPLARSPRDRFGVADAFTQR